MSPGSRSRYPRAIVRIIILATMRERRQIKKRSTKLERNAREVVYEKSTATVTRSLPVYFLNYVGNCFRTFARPLFSTLHLSYALAKKYRDITSIMFARRTLHFACNNKFIKIRTQRIPNQSRSVNRERKVRNCSSSFSRFFIRDTQIRNASRSQDITPHTATCFDPQHFDERPVYCGSD